MAYKNPEDQKANGRKWYLQNTAKHKAQAKRSRYKLKGPRRVWLQEIKSNLKCKTCGESRFYCLSFHHREPGEKDFNISEMYLYSKKRILEEAAKCDVLCYNCHAEVHWKEGLPATADLSGMDPNFTGELSTEEYIESLRGGLAFDSSALRQDQKFLDCLEGCGEPGPHLGDL